MLLRFHWQNDKLILRWGKKLSPPPYQFFPVNSKNVKTSWLLVLTPFSHCCKKVSRPYSESVPNYLTWPKTYPQKKWLFWSNPYKINIMITSLIEMLELLNFAHMTTSIIQFDSCDKNCWWCHGQKLWNHNLYFKKT